MEIRQTMVEHRQKNYRVVFAGSGRPIVVALRRANGNELAIEPKGNLGKRVVQLAREKLKIADPDKREASRWDR